MAYVRREFPEKSWSVSRQGILSHCARQYYYHYYASHNGWERSASDFSKEAYRLKQLTNLYLVLGDALHVMTANTIERIRQGAPVPTEKQLVDEVRDHLNKVYAASKNNRERFLQSPKRNPMLHEMYYGYGPSDDLIEKIKERLHLCVRHLLTSDSFLEVTSDDVDEVRGIDQLDSFLFLNTKVYAVPDLFYRLKNGTWVIADWKTGGESDDHLDQVKVYALYAREKHGIDPGQMIVRIEYLVTGQSVEYGVSHDDLGEIETLIEESLNEMDAYLLDPYKNSPRPIEAFPLVDDKRRCRFCNFYAFCKEEIESDTSQIYNVNE